MDKLYDQMLDFNTKNCMFQVKFLELRSLVEEYDSAHKKNGS